jgi:hypothetical protein
VGGSVDSELVVPFQSDAKRIDINPWWSLYVVKFKDGVVSEMSHCREIIGVGLDST